MAAACRRHADGRYRACCCRTSRHAGPLLPLLPVLLAAAAAAAALLPLQMLTYKVNQNVNHNVNQPVINNPRNYKLLNNWSVDFFLQFFFFWLVTYFNVMKPIFWAGKFCHKNVKTSKTKSGKKCRDRSAESCLRTSSVSEWRPQELVLILQKLFKN